MASDSRINFLKRVRKDINRAKMQHTIARHKAGKAPLKYSSPDPRNKNKKSSGSSSTSKSSSSKKKDDSWKGPMQGAENIEERASPDVNAKTGQQIKLEQIRKHVSNLRDANKIDPNARYQLENGEIVTGQQLRGMIFKQTMQNIRGSGSIPPGVYIEKSGQYYRVTPEVQYIYKNASPQQKEAIIRSLGVKQQHPYGNDPFQEAVENAYETLAPDDQADFNYRYADWKNIPPGDIKYYPGGQRHLENLSAEERMNLITRYLMENKDPLTDPYYYASKGGIYSGKLPSHKEYQRELAWDIITKSPEERREKYFENLPLAVQLYSSAFHGTASGALSPISITQDVIKLTTGKQIGPSVSNYLQVHRPGGPTDIISAGVSEIFSGDKSNEWEKFMKKPGSGIAATFGMLFGSYLGFKGAGYGIKQGLKYGGKTGTWLLGKTDDIYNIISPHAPGFIRSGYQKLFAKTYPGKFTLDVGTGNLRRSGGIISRFVYESKYGLKGSMARTLFLKEKPRAIINYLVGGGRSTKSYMRQLLNYRIVSKYTSKLFGRPRLLEAVNLRMSKIPFLNKVITRKPGRLLFGSKNIWTTYNKNPDFSKKLMDAMVSKSKSGIEIKRFLELSKGSFKGLIKKNLTVKTSGIRVYDKFWDDIVKIGGISDDITKSGAKEYGKLVSNMRSGSGSVSVGGSFRQKAVSMLQTSDDIMNVGLESITSRIPSMPKTMILPKSGPSSLWDVLKIGSMSLAGGSKLLNIQKSDQLMKIKQLSFSSMVQDQALSNELKYSQMPKQIQKIASLNLSKLAMDTSSALQQKSMVAELPMIRSDIASMSIGKNQMPKDISLNFRKLLLLNFEDEFKKEKIMVMKPQDLSKLIYRERTWNVPKMEDLLNINNFVKELKL